MLILDSIFQSAQRVIRKKAPLPYSVYAAHHEQRIVNVPIIKPLMICVLEGEKHLGFGLDDSVQCETGEFILLSNRAEVDFRNIPGQSMYKALLIDFDLDDFECLPKTKTHKTHYTLGRLDKLIQTTLLQFVDWAEYAPATLWSHRRQELLKLLYQQGYEEIADLATPRSFSHRLSHLIHQRLMQQQTINAQSLAEELAMSESTLRRKLHAENLTLQTIKDQLRLGMGLHLIQTRRDAIGIIADQCGFASQSRFAEKFKKAFGIAPSALRKTKLPEKSEKLS